MLKRIIKITVLILFALLAVLSLALIPSPQPDAPKPWDIDIHTDGQPIVMGIHLGEDSYRDAQQIWHDSGEIALFSEDDKVESAEVFFDRINLAGLSAKIVVNLAVSDNTLKTMAERGRSRQLQPSGARRIEPAYDDRQTLLDAPIVAITYLPNFRPDVAMLQSRFGQPDKISLDKADPDAEIWHYPSLGLTIRVYPDDKPVLLYQTL
ncbi:hypothetical protein Q7C_448 [Methylophaga frappieri]|uniref:Lytic murein transglycosylase n=1 Tax=Methylophaga frappieri (strain ATCC BAA-2434 / DSM 25690 / JAM7) TaxID=754477 RepID=I1YFD0_METFJ|nr:hypothetical protein [Methylophaga frappieri]AFJ01623.1 hypothetical protein Q7C_448 [Methylophaga frappieri]